jgi:hypothetical protein
MIDEAINMVDVFIRIFVVFCISIPIVITASLVYAWAYKNGR